MKKLLGTGTLMAVLAFAPAGFAQTVATPGDKNAVDHNQGDVKSTPGPGQENKARRLESVNWNSVQHRLTWVITDGVKTDAEGYQPEKAKTYRIEMDKAVMQFNGERRHFSEEEAASVHALMDLIAKYAVESTLWWDAGQGEKLDGQSGPRASVASDPLAKRNLVCMLNSR